MNMSLDAVAVAPPLTPSIVDERPSTLVLQPSGALDGVTSAAFRERLERSLEQVLDGVIVDFLWVDSTDKHGIAALVAGIRRAIELHKDLSFQGLDCRTRAALEQEWERLRQQNFGSWSEAFEQNLECFLDNLKR